MRSTWSLLLTAALGAPTPRVALLPSLSRRVDAPSWTAPGTGAQDYACVAALDAAAATLLNQIFGACFSLGEPLGL